MDSLLNNVNIGRLFLSVDLANCDGEACYLSTAKIFINKGSDHRLKTLNSKIKTANKNHIKNISAVLKSVKNTQMEHEN